MTAAQSPQPTDSDGPTRRGFLERIGVGTGAVVTLGVGGSAVAPQFSPVGRAQAFACGGLCIGAAAAGSGVVIGWALGEWDPLESDSAPEGLTPEALENRVYETVRTRKSTNGSTFTDNRNILDGVEHAAYGDAKVAAIEALNNEKTEADVSAAATKAVDDYETTVKQNFLKGWNESTNEFESLYTSLEDHSDTTPNDLFTFHRNDGDNTYDVDTLEVHQPTHEFPDGSTIDVNHLKISSNSTALAPFDTGHDSVFPDSNPTLHVSYDGNTLNYLSFDEWNAIWTEMDTVFDSVRNGIITWVEGVYSDVQTGELDTEDLLTPRELAQMSADEEGVNQAIADLMALNIPVDLEREATISVESENETATLSGMLAPTTPPANGIVSGETYDPSTMEGDIYFNYDISQGSAVWTAYDSSGVDGGIVTFTSEPYEGTLFRINTTAGEQATVASGDFTLDDGGTPDDGTDDVWTVDISEQVETAITDIEDIEMVAESGDTQYQMIILDQPFTVEKIENSETGEEADSMEFSNDEPQDDSNYITEEEWQQMQERNQELIDKYEESQNDSGSIVDGLDPDALAEDYGGVVAGLVIIFVALSTVVGYVTGNIPGMGD